MATATNKTKKNQLGKGMAALLGAGAAPSGSSTNALDSLKESARTIKNEKTEIVSSSKKETNTGPMMVSPDQIVANKEQPRKIFKEKEILELAESIKENGIIQPLIVTNGEQGKFLLIAGERRLRAAKKIGLEYVPVVFKKTSRKETLVMAIIENVQRQDLNCVEEGLAYAQLMSDFGLTQEEVAKKIGKERSTIANFLRILKLPREVLQYLQKDEVSFGHAKLLVSLKDDEKVKRLAREVVENQLSVRELEKLIKSGKSSSAKEVNPYFDDKLDGLKQKLEKRTGFHFDLKNKNNGSGLISIKFNNEAEFNDIYEFLMTK